MPETSMPEITMVEVEALNANPKNARKHPDHQIDRLAKSIIEFGFTAPVLCGPDFTLVAGHGRVEAARRAGVREVPTIVLEHLDPAQLQAYMLADNQLAEGATWDLDILSTELRQLEAVGFDMDILGWEPEELSFLVGDDDHKASDDVGRDKNTKEALDTYLAGEIKQIVLYFDPEEYEEVLAKLAHLMETYDLPNHTAVFQFLLTNLVEETEDDADD